MNGTVVRRASATPVRVPARSDSLNSPEIRDEDGNSRVNFEPGSSKRQLCRLAPPRLPALFLVGCRGEIVSTSSRVSA